jgi:colanic acid/amylovoran biosynthesis protein
MKITITNAFSLEQKGDSALLAGTIQKLRETFPDAALTAQIMGRTNPGDTFENVPIMDSPIYIATARDIPKSLKLFRMLYVVAASLLWATLVRALKLRHHPRLFLSPRLHQACASIAGADLVVPVAGGYIAGRPSLISSINIVIVLTPIWVAHILGRPVVHFSQSIGPLGNAFQRFLVRHTLRRARLEGVSTNFALGLGLNPARVARSIDAGFWFQPDPRFQLKDAFEPGNTPSPNKPLVGITTKEHLSPAAQARYERELAAFADWLVTHQHMQPIFVPQITSPALQEDDRILGRRVRGLMQHPEGAFNIEKNLTNHQTKSLINSLDYMVGTRFHSVIFALTGYIPSMAIEYEHKTSGIMQDLGLQRWIIKMEAVTAPGLIAMFTALVAGREAYLAHLHTKLPPYLDRAGEVCELIKNVTIG